MGWEPDWTLITEEGPLLRELKKEGQILQAKHSEWAAKYGASLRIDPAIITAFIAEVDNLNSGLARYRQSAAQLRDKGYPRADEQLARLINAHSSLSLALHKLYREALQRQTNDEIQADSQILQQQKQAAQDEANKRWYADFSQTCIHCKWWLGDSYAWLEICPHCELYLHK